ncbi:MAG TPA: hypothetical protein VFD33_05660 [Bacillota bacterium]|nr:hypothetical protein [Bacillota bacterium]
MRKALALSLMLVMVFTISACHRPAVPDYTEEPSDIPSFEPADSPDPQASSSPEPSPDTYNECEIGFEDKYQCRTYDLSLIEDFVGEGRYEDNFYLRDFRPHIYQAIKEYDINVDDFGSLYGEGSEKKDQHNHKYTDEEIAILYSDDINKINETFRSPYTLYDGEEVYTIHDSLHQYTFSISSVKVDKESFLDYLEMMKREYRPHSEYKDEFDKLMNDVENIDKIGEFISHEDNPLLELARQGRINGLDIGLGDSKAKMLELMGPYDQSSGIQVLDAFIYEDENLVFLTTGEEFDEDSVIRMIIVGGPGLEPYNVKVGMTFDEIIAVLGEPTSMSTCLENSISEYADDWTIVYIVGDYMVTFEAETRYGPTVCMWFHHKW